MQPRLNPDTFLRLDASMQLPHERHSLPLLPPSCSMETCSTLLVHGTTTGLQLAACLRGHDLAALVHGVATLKSHAMA